MTQSGKESTRFVEPGALPREEIARLEIGRTHISRRMAGFLVAFFVAIIVSVSATDFFRASRDSEGPMPADRIVNMLIESAIDAHDATEGIVEATFAANRRFLLDIEAYEDRLVEASILTKHVRPLIQLALAAVLGAGSQDAYVGKDGWLFYRPGLEYQWGPGFLEAGGQTDRTAARRHRAAAEADSLRAIREFSADLERRGISLIVMPTPVKGVIHSEAFTSRAAPLATALQNESYAAFVNHLRKLGIGVFDPTSTLLGEKTHSQRFLKADTHWTPRALEDVAAALAETLRADHELLQDSDFEVTERAVTITNRGDVASMMRLPERQALYSPESVAIRQVLDREGDLIQPDRGAEVLLLGDSFTNVYSLESMGWGSGAGLAERLAYNLRAPIDAIVINDGGAFAARQALARELARGDDRLRGKRVVVWQFAVRELVFGQWKRIPLVLTDREEPPVATDVVIVEGTVAAISISRDPGIVYSDYLRMLHLVEIETLAGTLEESDLVSFIWSIREGEMQPGSSIRQGERIRLKLIPWAGVDRDLDRVARSELDELDLVLRMPWWGEILETE